MAAIRSALLLGEPGKAQEFLRSQAKAFSVPERRALHRTITLAASSAAHGQPTRRAGVLDEDALAPISPTPEVSPINNGEPTATSYFTWVLHGSTTTPIYYGYCGSSGCTTLGYEVGDLEANTLYSYDGVLWYMDVTPGGGSVAQITNNTEVLKQDRSLGSDPTLATYSCTNYGTSLSCSQYRDPAMSGGNWYYIEASWVNNVAPYPSDAYGVQTRRWQANTASSWQFEIYANGG